MFRVCCVLALACAISACEKKQAGEATSMRGQPAAAPGSLTASQILERSRSLDKSRTSTLRIRVKVEEADGAAREVQMTTYRKTGPDGSQAMLVEFTAPPEERDRDALIFISPKGDIEAVRFAQSTNAFVSTTGVFGEDSLFGMTLQELVNGQPEKYDLHLVGEEAAANAAPAYKIEGRLKPGAESKFTRLVLLVAKEGFADLGAEFYDNEDKLARRMSVKRIEQVEGIPTRMRWSVDNAARRKKIDFQVLKASYNQDLDDSIFTREHLKKIASKS